MFLLPIFAKITEFLNVTQRKPKAPSADKLCFFVLSALQVCFLSCLPAHGAHVQALFCPFILAVAALSLRVVYLGCCLFVPK